MVFLAIKAFVTIVQVHHTFQAPFGMVAEYAHPAETMSESVCPAMTFISVSLSVLPRYLPPPSPYPNSLLHSPWYRVPHWASVVLQPPTADLVMDDCETVGDYRRTQRI